MLINEWFAQSEGRNHRYGLCRAVQSSSSSSSQRHVIVTGGNTGMSSWNLITSLNLGSAPALKLSDNEFRLQIDKKFNNHRYCTIRKLLTNAKGVNSVTEMVSICWRLRVWQLQNILPLAILLWGMFRQYVDFLEKIDCIIQRVILSIILMQAPHAR